MFDWEDQELANIIWGEVDDHIVPFLEESENKSQPVFVHHGNNEANEEGASSKHSEQKPSAIKTKLHGRKPESNDDLSFLASNPELICIGKETGLENGSGISKDQNDARELGDIIGNSWANIGSFDDLDHIFSNDVLVGNANLDTTDELWTPARDAVKSSSLALDSTSWRLEPLGDSSDRFDFNIEYLQNGNQSFDSGFEKPADSTCYTQEMLHSGFDEGEIDGTTDPNLILEETAVSGTGKTRSEPEAVSGKAASTSKSSNKDKWSRSQSKHVPKSDKINNDRQPQDLYDTWLPPEIDVQQFDCHSVSEKSKTHLSPAVLDQENMLHQSTCLPYQHFSNPYLTTYSYGNLSDQCTSMSVLLGTDHEHQPPRSSERVSIEKSTNTPIKSQNMTPQEKIEKLRRRQQMRALLAIKKQQQQLSHSIPITDYSITQKRSKDDQALHLARADFEAAENTTAIYDPSSPLKQDGSRAISVEVVDHSVEDTLLYQLQDVVTKLDMKTRLCMRDSLVRLAQSAMQRHYASDSSTANRNGGCKPNILKENMINQESFIKMPSAETETNSIDRAVAHLLFHQPYKSTSKNTGTPPGLEMGASSSVPLRFGTKHSGSEHKISTHGSNTAFLFKEPQEKDLSEQPQADESMNQKRKQKMVES